MSVSITEIVSVDPQVVRVSFESTLEPATFRVYREGALISTIESEDGEGSVLLSIAPEDSPYIEILDDSGPPVPAYPGRFTIHWPSISGPSSFLIEEYVGGNWVELATVPAEPVGSNRFLTRWLEDGQVHQFRVTPIDSEGVSGTAVERSALMVRHPDVPQPTVTYSAVTAKVTVS